MHGFQHVHLDRSSAPVHLRGARQFACASTPGHMYAARQTCSVLRRFFCGPNAKKSAALAKQQKKRPRGDDKGKGKQAAAGADSDEESAAEDSGACISEVAVPSEVAVLSCCCSHSSMCRFTGARLEGVNSTLQRMNSS